MGKNGCFYAFKFSWKRKRKVSPKGTDTSLSNGAEVVQVKSQGSGELEQKSLLGNVEVANNHKHDSLLQAQILKEEEEAYEGINNEHYSSNTGLKDLAVEKNYAKENSEANENVTPEEFIYSGHASDPGLCRETSLGRSPVLTRSCSNIETNIVNKIFGSSNNSSSFDDFQNLTQEGITGSPISMLSAGKVLTKKNSSREVLPSHCKELLLHLFLQSRTNIHETDTSNTKACYCSDMVEVRHCVEVKKKEIIKEQQDVMCSNSRWLTFSSLYERVNAWVDSIENVSICKLDEDNDIDDGKEAETCGPIRSEEIGESSSKTPGTKSQIALEDVSRQANKVVKSLSSRSTAIHSAEMKLKVIPIMSGYNNLRSVNLAGNMIARISPGSLPKNLQALDLSRNNISKIEGLKELTRLKILNLSCNKILRIGQGLSNCTIIKVLNLSGNKISDVEGLHRLLKLNVLDLSFNKLTTIKSLHQLVANYKSLLALNLLSNPIVKIISNEQLKNTVRCILPHLTYLNKQHVKQQRGGELNTESFVKAALGNTSWSHRRRTKRRGSYVVGQGSVSGLKNRSRR